ncbi:hypothetical protein L1787_08440 [Acuticoccus sp. M5D2P5]|uniref:hypothetical protein n=1 Tax=Acuticoccus kalidii TaxID=2910977 RepID=UPI001F446D3B|nr:hypothetical protein [Acuticoccus kalidii]MCF3933436.1 hypothetical protein [Acuticoccus kalidii]
MMKRVSASIAILAMFAAVPAMAATEEECEAAIAQTQADMESDAALQANDDRANEMTTMLAEAGEAGEQGNYEECLQKVEDTRGAAGLRVQ